jgi:hypothetical protein
MIPVQLGVNARTRISDNAMEVGNRNAADYMNAYGQLGANAMGLGTTGAGLTTSYYNNLGGLDIDNASDVANLELAEQIAERNNDASRTNALIGIGGSLLGSIFNPFSGDNLLGDLFKSSSGQVYSPSRVSTYPLDFDFGEG